MPLRAWRGVLHPFDDVRADDLYLAIACAARVKQAIIEFDKHYLAGLASHLGAASVFELGLLAELKQPLR